MSDLFGDVPDLTAGRPRSTRRPTRRSASRVRPTQRATVPRDPKPDLVTLILQVQHRINGELHYGPGSVTVPRDVARVLMEQETRAQEEQDRFDEERAAIIGPRTSTGHIIHRVPYDQFDHYNARAMPIERISGKGALSNPAGTPEF